MGPTTSKDESLSYKNEERERERGEEERERERESGSVRDVSVQRGRL